MGTWDVVEFLVNNDATVDLRDSSGRSRLSYAAKRGQAHVVQLLLKQGANSAITSAEGWTPLAESAHNLWLPTRKFSMWQEGWQLQM